MIYVTSNQERGTTFTICLPASEKKIDPEKIQSNSPLKGDETILLVDDEEMVTEVGKQLLEALGYKAITVNSGHDALELLKNDRHSVDLVILEMIMPGLSGSETFAQLKSLAPSSKHCYQAVIAWTVKLLTFSNRVVADFFRNHSASTIYP